jgi:hypothetical protein
MVNQVKHLLCRGGELQDINSNDRMNRYNAMTPGLSP